MEIALLVLFLFVICGIPDMPADDQDRIFWSLGFIAFVLWLFGKKDETPNYSRNLEESQKKMESVVNSDAPLEEKKRAVRMLDQMDKMK